MYHRCAKFKTKPLEHLDLMEKTFVGAAATGKHEWTPIEIRDVDGTDDNAATPNSGMGPLSGGIPLRDVPNRVGENMVDCSLFDIVDGSTNAKHRKRAVPSTVASSMDNLVEAARGGLLFSFACSLMDSLDNCDLLMGLSLDYILNWLKKKRVITHRPIMVKRSRGIRLFGQDGVVDMD
ncbi:hypothetical protein CsSME_00005001 [Camellia sinensis var. sinensis]